MIGANEPVVRLLGADGMYEREVHHPATERKQRVAETLEERLAPDRWWPLTWPTLCGQTEGSLFVYAGASTECTECKTCADLATVAAAARETVAA